VVFAFQSDAHDVNIHRQVSRIFSSARGFTLGAAIDVAAARVVMFSIVYSTALKRPGYNPHANRERFFTRVCCAKNALSAIAATLRFLSRRLSKMALWWDDWLSLLIALPYSWGLNVLMIYCKIIGLEKQCLTRH